MPAARQQRQRDAGRGRQEAASIGRTCDSPAPMFSILCSQRLPSTVYCQASMKQPRHGVARAISKLGLGSRTQAAQWVKEGRVRVNGKVVHDVEFPVRQGLDRVEIDGQVAKSAARLVLMLNKPRGLVTTAQDEQGRDTVYSCFTGADLPWLAPVGRLDKASEGLLLFSNDPAWAAQITDPETGPSKTYHVQIDRLPDEALLASLEQGVMLGRRAPGRDLRSQPARRRQERMAGDHPGRRSQPADSPHPGSAGCFGAAPGARRHRQARAGGTAQGPVADAH